MMMMMVNECIGYFNGAFISSNTAGTCKNNSKGVRILCPERGSFAITGCEFKLSTNFGLVLLAVRIPFISFVFFLPLARPMCYYEVSQ